MRRARPVNPPAVRSASGRGPAALPRALNQTARHPAPAAPATSFTGESPTSTHRSGRVPVDPVDVGEQRRIGLRRADLAGDEPARPRNEPLDAERLELPRLMGAGPVRHDAEQAARSLELGEARFRAGVKPDPVLPFLIRFLKPPAIGLIRLKSEIRQRSPHPLDAHPLKGQPASAIRLPQLVAVMAEPPVQRVLWQRPDFAAEHLQGGPERLQLVVKRIIQIEENGSPPLVPACHAGSFPCSRRNSAAVRASA